MCLRIAPLPQTLRSAQGDMVKRDFLGKAAESLLETRLLALSRLRAIGRVIRAY